MAVVIYFSISERNNVNPEGKNVTGAQEEEIGERLEWCFAKTLIEIFFTFFVDALIVSCIVKNIKLIFLIEVLLINTFKYHFHLFMSFRMVLTLKT